MDLNRCKRCGRRLIAATGVGGRTSMVCLKCDEVDPMKTVAKDWAQSSLSRPGPAEPES